MNRRYNEDMDKLSQECIPILSTIHSFLNTQMKDEKLYVVNGEFKRLKDFERKIDRSFADTTVNSKEIVEKTFLDKIQDQLKKMKKKEDV